MSLNFNVGPYHDDFDPTKNFHRILFKPGVAVQARELTQSQTILQDQVSNFASSIFSQNTPVSGGQVTTNQNCYYLKLNPTAPSGSTVTAANFANQIIQDASGVVLAKVIATVETTTSGTVVGDPPTLIVSYLSGAHFTDGMLIATTTTQTTQYATIATSVPTSGNYSTGLSSTASIADGVFYIVNGYSVSETTGQKYSIGNFVNVSAQTVVLDKYDNTPSFRVGLQINETIYDYINDPSLLDPAIGATNYQAPGADRYVITLTLIALPLTPGQDDGFIQLLRIENGNIVKQVDGTVYSTIDDYFAKRDYETNGDYLIEGFTLTPSANSMAISSKYDMKVGKGVAYVHGYRVENQSQIVIPSNRSQATSNINNNSVFVDYGNYYVVDTANGVFDISTVPQVDFHSVGSDNIVSTNNTTYTSTLAGKGFIRNLTYVSGTGSNTKTYVYNAFISDIQFNTLSGNITSGTSNSFVITDTTGKFSAVANSYYNTTVSVTTGNITDVRNIVNYVGSTKTVYVDNLFTVAPTSSSTFSLNFQQYDVESIVKTVSSNNYNLIANTNINTASGKVNGLVTGDTILNNPGTPELLFSIGYPYVAQLASTSYYSQRVYRQKTFSGNTLTLQATSGNSSNPLRFEGAGTLSGTVAEQLFIVIDNSTGNILDFTTTGNNITISGDKTTATFTVGPGVGTNKNVTVIAEVQVSSGDSSNYILKSKNLVTGNTTYASSSFGSAINTNTYQDLTVGQVLISKAGISTGKMSLYVNDVKRIVKIIDSGVAGVNPTGALINYTDITNYFTLDNGQRDTYYDHANISLLAGAPLPTGNILVVFDYYSHTQASSGDGYFSIQSYQAAGSTYGGVSTAPEKYPEIPTFTAKDGFVYKLSDSIDFRPCRANGQTNYVWEYSGTQTATNDVGVLIPQNLSNFLGNYYYYLARRDKLVLTKDKNILIIEGTPSTAPIYPVEPTGSLVLANLSLEPYTAYVPGENTGSVSSNLSIEKILHKRWAKSDITDLESRINNLEYYTSLSILEQNAQALQIADSNGLNRFKNGILVDDFSSFATADTSNPDYMANINIRQNQMTAMQHINNFQLQNQAVVSSLGTLANTSTYAISSINGTQTNVFTLPYTTANAVVQSLASSTVSANPFSVVVQQGSLQMNPPMDNWVDNKQAPAILITDPSMQVYQATGGSTLINSGDWQTYAGTTSTSTSQSITQAGITTTTQTYASQLQNITSSVYNPTSSTFATNDGYLTNIAVLPYIRPQQIIVRATGLLVNANVSTLFDGQDVSQYMTSPNTIELTNVSGTFKQDDVVGFYLSNTFYPVARVIQVYNYPNNTKTRLYVADIVGAPNAIGTTTLQNATFNSSGTYVGTTAQGTISGTTLINVNQSGYISGVGGGYANTLNSNTITQFYGTPIVQSYSTFLNNYGVWGDAVNGTYWSSTIPITFTTAGTYTIAVGTSGNATFYANGTSIGTSYTDATSTTTFNYTTAAATVNFGWVCTSSGTTTSALAWIISDSLGNIIYTSVNPPVNYTNAGTEVLMPKGGAWFTGATQLRLDPSLASNVSNFYVGSSITITSKLVSNYTVSATYTAPAPAPSAGPGYVDEYWWDTNHGGAGDPGGW
jgi:hypothetical protein